VKRSLPTAVLLIGLCGCGSGTQAERVVVSGKVTFAGKPVTGGSIRIVSADDPTRQIHGRIRNDGTFTLSSAPVGRVLVAVETASVLEGADSPDRGVLFRGHLIRRVEKRHAAPGALGFLSIEWRQSCIRILTFSLPANRPKWFPAVGLGKMLRFRLDRRTVSPRQLSSSAGISIFFNS